MKKIISVLLIIFSLIALTSCNKYARKIEGYWKGTLDDTEVVMYFGSNMKGKSYYTTEGMSFYMNFEYEIDRYTVTLILADEENIIDYSIKDGVLTFDGTEMTKATEDDVPENAEDLNDYIMPEGESVVGYWEGDIDGQTAGMLFEDGGTGKIFYFIDNSVCYAEMEWETSGGEIAIVFLENASKSEYSVDGNTLKIGNSEFTKKSDADIPSNAINITDAAVTE